MKTIKIVLNTLFFFFLIQLLLGVYSRADIYKYKNEKGVWCYTNKPANLPEDSAKIKNIIESKSIIKDLQNQLSAIFPQRNKIERAICGVVAIKSTLGVGSGFFITDDGYIITNKHVLKGDVIQDKINQSRIEHVEDEIKRIKKNFDEEEKRLKETKAKLEKDKKYIDSLTNYSIRKRNLEQYEYYINRYKEWENDFNIRKKQFIGQKVEINEKISDYNYDKAIADLSHYFKILIADDTELDVYLVSISKTHDLALLKLDGYKTPFLKPADPQEKLHGETVYAIGNPAEMRNSVAKGIISGFEGNFIKTDAKIYPGNSGGPLITEDGKVIGINTFKQLTRKFEGLGFAISIRTAINEFKSELGNYIKFE